MSWIRRTLFRFPKTLLFVVLATAFYQVGWHTPKLPLPPEVRRSNIRVTLTGEEVSASVYAPRDMKEPAPAVIVAHGFSRSRRYMVGWGMALAQNGMIAVVVNQPAFTDWGQNGRALAELARQLRTEGDGLTGLKTNGDVALVGFSMGGLSTLLAAEADPKARCWIGLDPVDFKGRGARAIQKLDMPCCILRAEPGPWNRDGNARRLVEAAKRSLFALKVKNATHCDVEEPTDLAGKLACGWTDPARHDVFEEYAVAFLRGVLLGDDETKAALDRAKNNERVEEVVRRGPAVSVNDDFRFIMMVTTGLQQCIVDRDGKETMIAFAKDSDPKATHVLSSLLNVGGISGTRAPEDWNGALYDQKIIVRGILRPEVHRTGSAPNTAESEEYQDFVLKEVRLGFPLSRHRPGKLFDTGFLETHFSFDTLLPDGLEFEGEALDLTTYSLSKE